MSGQPTTASDRPRVTVVIPTLGGPHLTTAVRSALGQTYERLDVVVSVDGPAPSGLAAELADPRVQVVDSAERRGPREARAAGVRHTEAEFVAFLDDDDRWRPTKVERQVAAAARAGGSDQVVVLCRLDRIAPDGVHHQTAPRRLLRPGQRLADYLFVRREVRPGESAAVASMVLASRQAVAAAGTAAGDAFLHEDWALLLTLDAREDVRFEMVDDVLLDYVVHPLGASASSRTSWRRSEEWFEAWRGELTAREWADGLLCVTAVLAAEQGDRRAAMTIARRVLRHGGAGVAAWVFFALTVLVPNSMRLLANRAVERVVARRRRLSPPTPAGRRAGRRGGRRAEGRTPRS